METNGNRISKVKDEEFSGFLSYLTGLKGYSEKTALSYGEDVASFLLFLSDEGKKKEDDEHAKAEAETAKIDKKDVKPAPKEIDTKKDKAEEISSITTNTDDNHE